MKGKGKEVFDYEREVKIVRDNLKVNQGFSEKEAREAANRHIQEMLERRDKRKVEYDDALRKRWV